MKIETQQYRNSKDHPVVVVLHQGPGKSLELLVPAFGEVCLPRLLERALARDPGLVPLGVFGTIDKGDEELLLEQDGVIALPSTEKMHEAIALAIDPSARGIGNSGAIDAIKRVFRRMLADAAVVDVVAREALRDALKERDELQWQVRRLGGELADYRKATDHIGCEVLGVEYGSDAPTRVATEVIELVGNIRAVVGGRPGDDLLGAVRKGFTLSEKRLVMASRTIEALRMLKGAIGITAPMPDHDLLLAARDAVMRRAKWRVRAEAAEAKIAEMESNHGIRSGREAELMERVRELEVQTMCSSCKLKDIREKLVSGPRSINVVWSNQFQNALSKHVIDERAQVDRADVSETSQQGATKSHRPVSDSDGVGLCSDGCPLFAPVHGGGAKPFALCKHGRSAVETRVGDVCRPWVRYKLDRHTQNLAITQVQCRDAQQRAHLLQLDLDENRGKLRRMTETRDWIAVARTDAEKERDRLRGERDNLLAMKAKQDGELGELRRQLYEVKVAVYGSGNDGTRDLLHILGDVRQALGIESSVSLLAGVEKLKVDALGWKDVANGRKQVLDEIREVLGLVDGDNVVDAVTRLAGDTKEWKDLREEAVSIRMRTEARLGESTFDAVMRRLGEKEAKGRGDALMDTARAAGMPDGCDLVNEVAKMVRQFDAYRKGKERCRKALGLAEWQDVATGCESVIGRIRELVEARNGESTMAALLRWRDGMHRSMNEMDITIRGIVGAGRYGNTESTVDAVRRYVQENGNLSLLLPPWSKALVLNVRKAREKHGDQSAHGEAKAGNLDRVVTILTEEVGEVAKAVIEGGDVAGELIDTATAAILAWTGLQGA